MIESIIRKKNNAWICKSFQFSFLWKHLIQEHKIRTFLLLYSLFFLRISFYILSMRFAQAIVSFLIVCICSVRGNYVSHFVILPANIFPLNIYKMLIITFPCSNYILRKKLLSGKFMVNIFFKFQIIKITDHKDSYYTKTL